MAGGQNFEQRNVQQTIFQNFEIAKIKITKNELFDSFIIELIFFFFEKLFSYSKYLTIFLMTKYSQIEKFRIVDRFPN